MIIPIAVITSVGLFFGLALSISAQFLHVEEDQKIKDIEDALPATNCGACGFPGCAGFAKAVASDEAPINGCLAGGHDVADAVAAVMGTEADLTEQMVAVVHCKGGYTEAKERATYDGIHDCHAAVLVGNSSKECGSGCLGLGSCLKTCSFDAITITDNGLAEIDPEKCTGCGACTTSCPRDLITMIPKDRKIFLACNNHDRGGTVKKYCSVGCTACTLCTKATMVPGSIVMNDFLPVLDYQKEDSFVAAVHKCPPGCFVDTVKARPKANITTKCTACGDCLPVCPVKGAIIEGERYAIDKSLCIGCGLCVPVCEVDAITMWGSLGYTQQ